MSNRAKRKSAPVAERLLQLGQVLLQAPEDGAYGVWRGGWSVRWKGFGSEEQPSRIDPGSLDHPHNYVSARYGCHIAIRRYRLPPNANPLPENLIRFSRLLERQDAGSDFFGDAPAALAPFFRHTLRLGQ